MAPNKYTDLTRCRESVCEYAHLCFRGGKDLFHRNVHTILDLCFPDLPFEAQIRFTWITDSVLCSAPAECGGAPPSVERECVARFLQPQLALFPCAVVAALGAKGLSQ